MKLILRIIALVFFAVAAFHGLISINLPLDFIAAGLFCWLGSEFVR